MTVRSTGDGTIHLEGNCLSEDAETLLQLLLAAPGSIVDWRQCEEAHAAVIQVLMAARPPMRGSPTGYFLKTFVAPSLEKTHGGVAPPG